MWREQGGEAFPAGSSRLTDVAGHEETFASLCERFHPLLWRFFYRRGFSAVEIQGSIQATFLRIHRDFASFRGDSRWEHWVFRLAIHEAREADALRHRSCS